ncbi:MAG: TetR family transcriptional regulator [Candidatus Limnocylindrales bacterium]
MRMPLRSPARARAAGTAANGFLRDVASVAPPADGRREETGRSMLTGAPQRWLTSRLSGVTCLVYRLSALPAPTWLRVAGASPGRAPRGVSGPFRPPRRSPLARKWGAGAPGAWYDRPTKRSFGRPVRRGAGSMDRTNASREGRVPESSRGPGVSRLSPEPGVAGREPTGRRPREAQLRRAAVRLFREHGYHGTSMQHLAEDLGLHRGSLYHYIDSKEDLLYGIVESVMARFHDEVQPILEGDGPARERLRRAVGAHLRIAADAPDELTLLQVEVKALAPARRDRVLAQRDAYEHAWRVFIRDGMREGVFRCEDERTAGFMILAACNWFSQWYRPGGPLGVDDFAGRFSDLFLGALHAGLDGSSAAAAGPCP